MPSAAAAPARTCRARSIARSAAAHAAARLPAVSSGKIARMPSPRNFSTSPPVAAHGLDHRLEIAIERGEQVRLAEPFAHRGEAAQVGEQDRRFDMAVVAAPDRAREHRIGRAVAEEGAQQARARAAHGGGLERRGQRLAQPLDQLEVPVGEAVGAVAHQAHALHRAVAIFERQRQIVGAARRGHLVQHLVVAPRDPDRPAGAGRSAGARSRTGTGCRNTRRSRAWSAAPDTRACPAPSRVQITPQALASGLASRCPARSRQSGTPRSTRRRQKPSIRSSGTEVTRASPISQRAISSAARSTLSGCSTGMSACQDDRAARQGGPGLPQLSLAPAPARLQTRPAMGALVRCGRAGAGRSRPEPVVVRAPDSAVEERAVLGSGLGSSSGRPHNREPTAKDRPQWPREARPPSRPAARSSATAPSAISPRRPSRPAARSRPRPACSSCRSTRRAACTTTCGCSSATTLKSWAVPQGPLARPHGPAARRAHRGPPARICRLRGADPARASTAPAAMIVWDRGTWIPMGDPEADYRKGTLKFRLAGEKLGGGWMLVRLKPKEGERGDNWLLIKERDPFARPGSDAAILEERPESVLSGRRVEDLAAPEAPPEPARRAQARGRSRPSALQGARKAPLPRTFRPQLASPAARAARRRGVAARDQVRRLPHDRADRWWRGAAVHAHRPGLDRPLRRPGRGFPPAALQAGADRRRDRGAGRAGHRKLRRAAGRARRGAHAGADLLCLRPDVPGRLRPDRGAAARAQARAARAARRRRSPPTSALQISEHVRGPRPRLPRAGVAARPRGRDLQARECALSSRRAREPGSRANAG